MPTVGEPFGVVRGRAVHLPDADAVVGADLHLGMAAAAGVEAPVGEAADALERLLALVDRFDPAEVVLAGDVLHAFGYVPREAADALATLRERVEAAGATLVAVVGNHDAQLAALDGPAPVEEHELADGTVVCHGHEPPAAAAPRYVVGHDHPAIVIEGRRRPCFLHGPGAYEGADVLALPAFNPAARGTAVNGWRDGDPLSPLLAEVSRFSPVVWDDDGEEALVFPRLDALRRFL